MKLLIIAMKRITRFMVGVYDMMVPSFIVVPALPMNVTNIESGCGYEPGLPGTVLWENPVS